MTASLRTAAAAFRRHLLHPVALCYLAAVAAVCAWVAVDQLLVPHQDASLSGVWAFFATAPTSLLLLPLPDAVVWAGIAAAAVVQAAVLGALCGMRVGGRRAGS